MSARWAMFIDVAKCHNCRNCDIACRDEHVGNDYPGYSAPQPKHGHAWIEIRSKERGSAPMVDVAYLPSTCVHCGNAPCMQAAGDAVIRREDGIVLIDPVKAKGRRDLVEACPYGAIWWNEELQLPQKWIFDAHLLDRGWAEPRAAAVCPTGAIHAAKLEDAEFERRCREEGWQPLRPGEDHRPRVLYRNLHRFFRAFVGGTVLAEVNGVLECVSGARVALLREGSLVAESTSDDFGEFRIDGLEEGSGRHELRVEHTGYARLALAVDLGASQYLGELRLQPIPGDRT